MKQKIRHFSIQPPPSQPSLQMTSGSASETERVVDSFGLASPVWSWPVDEVSDHKTLGKFAVFLKGLHP